MSECDHVVGLDADYLYVIYKEKERINTSYSGFKCKFCPECGAKLEMVDKDLIEVDKGKS